MSEMRRTVGAPKVLHPQDGEVVGESFLWKVPVDLAKGYHLMTYSLTGVEATAVELQDSTRTLCR